MIDCIVRRAKGVSIDIQYSVKGCRFDTLFTAEEYAKRLGLPTKIVRSEIEVG